MLALLQLSRPGAPLLRRAASTVVAAQHDMEGARPFQEMPGPSPVAVLGNLWRFFPVIGDLSQLDMEGQQMKFYKTYGKIVKLTGIPGRKNMVFIFDPEDAQKVFRNEGQWPVRDGAKSIGYYRTVLRKDLYQGVEGTISSQGEVWQRFRSKVNQPMMQPRSAKLYVAPIDQVAGDFIDRIRSMRDDKNEVPEDFINQLYKWSLESIATIALDTRLGCLCPELAPDSEPQQMIDAVQVMLDGIYKLDMRPSLWRYVSTPTWRKFVKAMDLFTHVSMKYIQQAMDRIRNKPVDSERDLSMLERLLLNNDNPMVACVMAIDMLFGGIDTTSHSTAVLLFHLSKHPEKQHKLYEELKRVLPQSKSQRISSEDLNEMKYLRACMKESMRMQPIVIGNMREIVQDMVLGNYYVPKGTDAFMCHMLMSRMEKHFPHPERFIPERWLKGDGQHHSAHPFTYMPFGFGSRMCVGRRFAELEILMLTAKIIRNFHVKYLPSDELTYECRAINLVTSPLNFKMVDRE